MAALDPIHPTRLGLGLQGRGFKVVFPAALYLKRCPHSSLSAFAILPKRPFLVKQSDGWGMVLAMVLFGKIWERQPTPRVWDIIVQSVVRYSGYMSGAGVPLRAMYRGPKLVPQTEFCRNPRFARSKPSS